MTLPHSAIAGQFFIERHSKGENVVATNKYYRPINLYHRRSSIKTEGTFQKQLGGSDHKVVKLYVSTEYITPYQKPLPRWIRANCDNLTELKNATKLST
uniref:Uncharacterized protein n=1 Tax=Arion vulgaris TaxID=1028688 RepID=A0A0B7A6N6_9EUPU